jgi:oxepin-CoA hydrolase/3-oxo-5,6-dehydrosuberyl-CoA semialdehyde dehydrogenase
MDSKKLLFITDEFPKLLHAVTAGAMGKWGKMNARQMTEHVADIFKVSSGKLHYSMQIPVELLPKYREFMLSDKEFRENTKAPETVIPAEPIPARNHSMEEAVTELQIDINGFLDHFKENPGGKTLHPVFGELNFDEWVQLHHKHLVHHAKQFGLI